MAKFFKTFCQNTHLKKILKKLKKKDDAIKGDHIQDDIQDHAQDKYLICSSWPKFDPPSPMGYQGTPMNQIWDF